MWILGQQAMAPLRQCHSPYMTGMCLQCSSHGLLGHASPGSRRCGVPSGSLAAAGKPWTQSLPSWVRPPPSLSLNGCPHSRCASGCDRGPKDGGLAPDPPAPFDRACPRKYVQSITMAWHLPGAPRQALAKCQGFKQPHGVFLGLSYLVVHPFQPALVPSGSCG